MRTKQFRVELSEAERAELLLLVGRGTAPARTVRRAHILLAAADDLFDAAVAAALHTSEATVLRVRRRVADAPPGERLGRALYDQPRPGAAPKLDAKGEATLVALACSDPPKGRALRRGGDRAERRPAGPAARLLRRAPDGVARRRPPRAAVRPGRASAGGLRVRAAGHRVLLAGLRAARRLGAT